MDTNNILQHLRSRKYLFIVAGIFGLAVLLGTFSVGMAVGYQKARFSYAWGESYQRNFGGPRSGFMGDFRRDLSGHDFINAHGTFGQVMQVQEPDIVLRGREGQERIIHITSRTEIRRFQDRIGIADLRVDDPMVVIGEPTSSGQIEARFIRVLPVPTMLPAHLPHH